MNDWGTPAPLYHARMSSFWHPFANMASVSGSEVVIERGEGVYVYDAEGKRYLDGTASLWYANVGYGRSEIGQAMAEQSAKLAAFHTFGDFSNRPAMELADRIAGIAPIPESKVFFTSGGSDSVDTAAKLARRYFAEIGQPQRTVFIIREWAYHGMHAYGTSLAGMQPNLETDPVGDRYALQMDGTWEHFDLVDYAWPGEMAYARHMMPLIGPYSGCSGSV